MRRLAPPCRLSQINRHEPKVLGHFIVVHALLSISLNPYIVSHLPLDDSLSDQAKRGHVANEGGMIYQERQGKGKFGKATDLDRTNHAQFKSSKVLDLTRNLTIFLYCKRYTWTKPWQYLFLPVWVGDFPYTVTTIPKQTRRLTVTQMTLQKVN